MPVVAGRLVCFQVPFNDYVTMVVEKTEKRISDVDFVIRTVIHC